METTPTLALGALLALASGVGWTGLDVLRKRLAAELSPAAILLGMTAVQVPLHGALMLASGVPRPEPAFFAWTGLGVVVAIAANLLLVSALRRSPLSLVTPYLSFTPAATLLMGSLLLQQRPSALGLLGVGVVALGAFLLNAGPLSLRRPLATIAAEPGSRLALGVALLFALGNAIDRRAVLHASEPAYAALLSLGVSAVLLVAPGPRRELAATPRRGLVLLAGLTTAAALLLQLLSFRFLFVAYTDALKRAASNLCAIAFGAWFFAEGAPGRRLVAAGVMSVGVALILRG